MREEIDQIFDILNVICNAIDNNEQFFMNEPLMNKPWIVKIKERWKETTKSKLNKSLLDMKPGRLQIYFHEEVWVDVQEETQIWWTSW